MTSTTFKPFEYRGFILRRSRIWKDTSNPYCYSIKSKFHPFTGARPTKSEAKAAIDHYLAQTTQGNNTCT